MLKNIILTISILLNIAVLVVVGIYAYNFAYTSTLNIPLLNTALIKVCSPTAVYTADEYEFVTRFCEGVENINYDEIREVDTAPPVSEPVNEPVTTSDATSYNADEYSFEYPSGWGIEDWGETEGSSILTLYPPTTANTGYGEGGSDNPLNVIDFTIIPLDGLTVDSYLADIEAMEINETSVGGKTAYKFIEPGIAMFETYLVELENDLYLKISTISYEENLQNLSTILETIQIN